MTDFTSDMEFLGEAVQVEPIKSKLKAPGTKCLKLKVDNLLSSVAFECNLRRYTWDGRVGRKTSSSR